MAGTALQTPNLSLREPVHYSGANARVYVEAPRTGSPIELDIATMAFTVADQKLPIYGYKSVYFDDVARGTVLVQGTFMLNMQRAFELTRYLEDSLRGQDTRYNFGNGSVDYLDSLFASNKKSNTNLTLQRAIPSVRFRITEHLSIEHGLSGELTSNKTGYIIDNVQVINSSLVTASSGEAVGEQYQFLSREIIPL